MFSRKINKQNKLKRLILRMLNVYAYDRESLNIVNPDIDKNQKNILRNYTSFNYARGYLKLSRKIKNLDIYFRYSPNNNLWNSTDRWKRIIPNINKKELISVCLLSLKESLIDFLNRNDLNVVLHLISDNSTENFDNQVFKLIQNKKFSIKSYKSKIKGNRGSYLECCDQAENAEDLIFFIEDDYLFNASCIEETIFSFLRFSTQLNNDVIMCPSDYPFYYDSTKSTYIMIGKDYKWRHIKETLLTFMFTKKILNEYRKEIRSVGENINEPFEKPLHKVYEKINCFAPIGSLSFHISRGVPAVNENWIDLWNKNYQKLKNFQ